MTSELLPWLPSAVSPTGDTRCHGKTGFGHRRGFNPGSTCLLCDFGAGDLKDLSLYFLISKMGQTVPVCE